MAVNDDDDLGVVLYWKDPSDKSDDPGSFYRLDKKVWEGYKIGDAESGLPAALVSRGAIVATMKDATHPTGSWSSLLNLTALYEAHTPDRGKAQARKKAAK